MASSAIRDESIPSIPADESRVNFVWYGDCCSGIPGGANEQNFAAVNAVFRRLDAQPDVVIFAGDNIVGYSDNAEDYRARWRYWLDHEMAWFSKLGIPILHITSNHNTTNEVAEAVFREIHADIPQNGPDDQKGLSYWVRQGDVLCVFVNTNFSGLGGSGHVEHEWLNPDALLDALKAGNYYHTQSPKIHDLQIDGSTRSIDCSPVNEVILSGLSWRGGGTIVDRAGKRAWTNPIWLNSLRN